MSTTRQPFDFMGGSVTIGHGKHESNLVEDEFGNPSEEAIWLASSIEAKEGDKLLEAGVGTGAASLCALQRLPRTTLTGVEMQKDLLQQLKANLVANDMDKRSIVLEGDITQTTLAAGSFEHTFANPPFHELERGFLAASVARSTARGIPRGNFSKWVEKMLTLTAHGGTTTLICHTHAEQPILSAAKPYAKSARIAYLQTSDKRAPKRMIVQFTRGTPPMFEIERLQVKAYDEQIRHAVLKEGMSVWDFTTRASI